MKTQQKLLLGLIIIVSMVAGGFIATGLDTKEGPIDHTNHQIIKTN